nr:uncharacterized protein LOC106686008 isoform X2 [Halyomorpha halys]
MSPLCAYAVDLKRFLLSPSFNWKFRRSSSHYINLKYRQWKIFCHEPFIALLYPARNELHIFQCFPKSVECIDIIRLKLLLDSSDSILINKRYIVMSAYNIVLVYKFTNHHFELYKVFASKYGASIISANQDFDEFIEEYTVSNYSVSVIILIGDRLWIAGVNREKYVINLYTGEQDMKKSLSSTIKVIKKLPYVLHQNESIFSITDINGKFISFMVVSRAERCYMNKYIVAICYPSKSSDDKYNIQFRLILTGKRIGKLIIPKTASVTLHPSKLIMYLFSARSEGYKVSAVSIITGVFLWDYKVTCVHATYWGAFLSVVEERFLFVYPAPSGEDFYAVFNLQGKLLYEELYFTSGILLYFSDEVILAKEGDRIHVTNFYKSIHDCWFKKH